MQGKSTFELIIGTVFLFLFLTIVVFIANMLFFNFAVNHKNNYRDMFMIFAAIFQTGLIMWLIVWRLRKKYRRQNSISQVKAFNVYMVILAGLVIGFDGYILYRKPNLFTNREADTNPAVYLEKHFNEIIDSSHGNLDSAILRNTIEYLRDTAYRDWNQFTDEGNHFQFRYPRYALASDSTYQIIEKKKYRIIQHKIIPDDPADPNQGYSASVILYDREKTGESEDDIFDTQREYLIHAMEASILSETEVKKDTYTGRQFYLDMPSLKLKAVTQVFSAHSRIYIFTVVTDYDHLFNHHIRKFFGGIKLEV